ncbi:glycosyltransferase family 2 protein [Candidatus Gottesmanbacteria bacterium]|nr:glycosyltransferase family 2 protein [Candidatus Gottesmanbacteria bacterium]
MKISLIVLNYNGKHLLKDYFDSVNIQTRSPDEIILFDNCSVDGSFDFVRKKYPNVRIIKEDSYNTGAVLGLNIASKYATGELFLFQSNDVRMDKNCIKVLEEAFKKNGKVGLGTSVSLTANRTQKEEFVENAGAEMDVIGFTWPLHYGKKRKEIPREEEVFCVYGNSIMVRAEIFKTLGGFDEKYFALHDDIDLSWRVRLLGYTVCYHAGSYVSHLGHATLGKTYNRAQKRYWSERNCLRTMLKNYSLKSLCIYLPFYICILGAEMGYHVRKFRFDLCIAIIRAIGWNGFYLVDTLKKRIYIQRIRKINDSQILPLLYHGSLKLRFGR